MSYNMRDDEINKIVSREPIVNEIIGNYSIERVPCSCLVTIVMIIL